MFAAYFWSVVCMGIVLAAGKFVAVSYLYRYWDQTGVLLRSYLLIAVTLLMMNTSMGIFGYLSAGYQADTAPLKITQEKITLLERELSDLQTRKRDIDGQISQLAPSDVKGKQRLDRVFYQETRSINARIPQLTTELQQLKMKTLEIESHVGPIIYIADAFGMSTDNATKYIILLLIMVFEPLAVVLSICLNVVVSKKPPTVDTEAISDAEDSVTNVGYSDAVSKMAFDLVSNRSVVVDAPIPEVSLIDDRVSDGLTPIADDEPVKHPEASISEETIPQNLVEPATVDDTNPEQSPSPTNWVIVDDTPQVPKESILDRWLKQRKQ